MRETKSGSKPLFLGLFHFKFSIQMCAACSALLISVFALCPRASAQTETVLYNFTSFDTDPVANLLFDAAGNLYGGSNSGGVFELTRQTDGSWTNKTIAAFSVPVGLTFDAAGNLYVTAIYGGARSSGGTEGEIFQLTPEGDGKWSVKSLHTFGTGHDGQFPHSAVVLDASGNLYGTTFMGGSLGQGIAYELSRQSNGSWKEIILHEFGSGSDGQEPSSSMIFDAAGNLYGTTAAGGSYGNGTIYELKPQEGGDWKEEILHSFGEGSDGGTPYTGLIFDGDGNLYGTTAGGGAYGFGTAYELVAQSKGGWKETILHNFGNGEDGIEPLTGLIFDGAGNLYGTTTNGGAYNCSDYYAGTVFELKRTEGGGWNATTLDSFCDADPGGGGVNGLIFGPSGDLYGTTYAGGTYGGGTAFGLEP